MEIAYRDWTGWLGIEDSNRQMSFSELAFEMWLEIPQISERLVTRDFSRVSCRNIGMHPSGSTGCWVAGFKLVSSLIS
jgi:hypothetical protein